MTKKVKLHHRVKNFYHKNPFRKFYTLIITGLIVANLGMLIFADSVYTDGSEHNNDWGGGNDSASNHYGLDLNNPEERQGPCEDGWHVPSRGEWQDIAVARCNQTDNSCDLSNDLVLDSYGNLNYISKNGLGTAFRTSFGMSDFYYWSSSPYPNDDYAAWGLLVNNANIIPNSDTARGYDHRVRCLKNSIGVVSDTSSLGLTTNGDGDYELTYNGKIYTIAGSDLDGTYYWGVNENTANTTGVAPGYGYGYGSTPQSCTITVNGNEEYLEYGETYGDGVSLYTEQHSCSASAVRCATEGADLGSWYTNCEWGDGNGYGYGYGYESCEAVGGEEWNTAELTTNSDGSKTITYDGKSYTIASGDLYGTYRRGNNIAGDSTNYNGTSAENNNRWGGGGDNVDNGYDSGNPRSEREGPCDDGWHVPSILELNDLTIAWCHLSSNECNSCDLKYTDDGTEQIKIENSNKSLGNLFQSDFGLSNGYYWSSSPHSYIYYAWGFDVGDSDIFNAIHRRDEYFHIRCIKDTVEDGGNGYGYGYGGEEPETDALIIPTTENYEVHVGGNTYTDELPSSMTVTTNNVQNVENETVLGEVSVNFGGNSNATFTELMQIKIPVEGVTRAVVKVKHAGSEEYNYDGLTTNRNASCSNGRPTSNQYNGTPISVVNGYVSIYTCEASSFIALGEGEISAQINLSVLKGTLTIGTETGDLNLGQVNVSNNAQTLSGSFGVNSFWVEDMKGVESGYYTTISVTDLTGTVAGHMISADNVSLKTAGNEPSNISGATASEAKVIFGAGITTWHSGSGQVNYFQRLNTAPEDAGRVGKWGDDLQIKVTIPAHTPYDTYRGTITYTLYDMDM